jgi:DNA-binding MarR family transcriptional regulator
LLYGNSCSHATVTAPGGPGGSKGGGRVGHVTAAEEVGRASRALVGIAARSLAPLEADGVTLAQYRALLLVAEGRAQGPGDLATGLGIHPSNATRLVDRLVAKGLLERETSDADRREVSLATTPAARRLLARVLDGRRSTIEEVLSALSPEEVSAIGGALRRFAEAAGEPADDAWRLGWGS